MSARSEIFLYYVPPPEVDRWVPGDRWVRPIVRRIVRGQPAPSGIDKTYLNIAAGLQELGVEFRFNRPWRDIKPGDRVGVFGRDRHCLAGYDRPNRMVAGVALMTHPSEWPTLCQEYPIAYYTQQGDWATEIYRPFFGDVCVTCPVGIETERWRPDLQHAPTTDFLLYNKIRWDHETRASTLLEPIRQHLQRTGVTFEEIRYGSYRPNEYAAALRRCRSLLFLCEHESQGFAYQEAMSAGLPVLAWDPGEWLDPRRFEWGTPHVPASSVPFFDHRCGERFVDFAAFPATLGVFLERLRAGKYAPRDYILEHLTLQRCAKRYLALLNDAAGLA
jgi:hypothetical protein